MLNAGSYSRCLSASRPSPFQWRNQAKTALVFKDQRRAKLLPLFLSAVVHNASNSRPPGHPGARVRVVGAGCSSPFVATSARPHWNDSEPQIVARLAGLFDPRSKSHLHSHVRKPLYPILFPAVDAVWLTTYPDDRQASEWAWISLFATGVPFGLLRLMLQRLLRRFDPFVTAPSLAFVALRVLPLSLLFSCPLLWHNIGLSFFNPQ